ncbi:major facilitator superfamily transporter, partial [Hortaea werneckii]
MSPLPGDDERFPPGTVRLIDLDGNVEGRHADGSSEKDVVLHPMPSEDPEDPLNWSFKRKQLATSCVIMQVFASIPSSIVYSVVTPIQEATSLVLDDLNLGTGVMFLCYGWACILWQPLALQYGKRPTYLVSMAANIAILASAPWCTVRSTYLANRCLQGFFGSPVESLCEISMTDIWFAHERPKYLGWYGFTLSLTGKLAPMLSGFINYGQDWRWSLWWCAIWIGISFVYCFFLMEETNFDRPSRHPQEPSPSTCSNSLQPNSGMVDIEIRTEKQYPKTRTSPTQVLDVEPGQTIYPRKSYWQKLSLVDKKRPNRMFDIFLAPFRGFTYPAVVYAGFMYGANNLVWTGIQNATTGTVYKSFYGWSTLDIAAAYSAGIIGAIIGGYACGKLGRVLTMRLARRNGGISESEHTLYMFIIPTILAPFSLLLYGLGVTYNIHWFGLVFSQGCLAVVAALSVAGALGYAISSYPELSGDMVTTCILIRNTLSFAINYGITPWVHNMGYRDTFIMAGCIAFAWNASFVVFIQYGRKLREKSAE